MKSCLIILYYNEEVDIIKNILSKNNIKSIQNIQNYLDSQNMKDNCKNIKIIRSNKVGVGKSTQIKLEIEKSKREYIYFPVGGEFSKTDLLKRLKDIKETKNINNGTFHIDLYDTENIELMNEFLFSILVTKMYRQNQDIFYLGRDIPIMIEIPNSSIDYMKNYPILELFDIKILKIEELPPFETKYNFENNVFKFIKK